ncbi:HEAT repeat domain-containing protein [Cryomorphaceae bacterium 1068]|nr:HEAT repeat domain-containing protein [Cryomorphaceae bacterium 1068]
MALIKEMNSLIEKKDSIVNFYDIKNITERDRLIEEIGKYTDSKEESEVVKEIRSNFSQAYFSGLNVIYIALSSNPQKWSAFFKEEYERAFETAKRTDNSFEILDCLVSIGLTDVTKVPAIDEIVELLENHLEHEKDTIRFKAIWYLGDWISSKNKAKYPEVIKKIRTRLRDDNWKIRYLTSSVLRRMDELSSTFKLDMMDRLKAKFYDPFELS